MKQIILDLLDYSKASKAANNIEVVDLNDLVEEYNILRRRLLQDKKAKIITGDLPNVKCYKAPLVQTLHSLLDNAIKYSKENEPPIINISVSETKNHWQISIEDNGIGIDPAFYDKIFIIFQRLHNRDRYDGTGIGLSIAKKHVELWGGKIWVESELGIGSTFHFTIGRHDHMKEVHILLVEDNEGDILLTLDAFEESKIRTNISVVRNGAEALDFLYRIGDYKEVNLPDLILLDINLPIYNGHEVLKKIKEDTSLKKIPVIILTTSSSQKDINKAYENYCNSYVSKPIDMDDFLKVILKIDEFWLQLSKLAK